jgi:S-DNA-T family DNA segregation ATPase FtsK/SpoIIIE
MPQSPKTASSRRTAAGSKTPPKPDVPTKTPGLIRILLEDPNALRNLRHHLPTWADEFFALVLIGIGAVMFASLLNAGGEGELSSLVSEILRKGFGKGAFVISVGVLLGGILILLPKAGIRVSFSLGKFIALELSFICFQGLLHALEFEKESQALAREGGGGGYVGWAINNKLVMAAIGEPANIILFGVSLFFSLQWLVGISRRHYRQLFDRIGDEIAALATRLDPQLQPPREESPGNVQPAMAAMADMVGQSAQATGGSPATQSPPLLANEEDAAIRRNRKSLVPREEPIHLSEIPPTVVTAAPSEPKPQPQRKPANPPPVEANPTHAARTQAPPPAVAMAAEMLSSAVHTLPIPAPLEVTPKPADTEPISEDLDDSESESQEFIERTKLIVNGQEIDAAPLNVPRPSIVPRNGDEDRPKPAFILPPKQQKPRKNNLRHGRDNDPNKRYFTVEDIEERKRVGKRDEHLPPLELLNSYEMFKPDEEEINQNASIIEFTLEEFDINADVIDVKVGPVVTQYAVSPIKERVNPETGQMEVVRVRVDKITSLQGDLALALSAKTLRIEAPVPGHSYVGIEVPNRKPSIVGLRPVLESETFFREFKHPLAVPLGRDVSGEPIIIELASLPHLLVAGTTGSGKSVFLTALITAIVMNNMPDRVKFIMLDPKRVELTRFNGLPHLLGPVETDPDRIIGVLRWATREMDRRYKLLELENARNIDVYNANLGRRRKNEHLPYIVLVFDEIGDMMISYPDEMEGTITRLAQKARAAGIHLVVATQRPSTEVLTGLIKANFPGRLSFAVASGVDSRVILDWIGAETLLGRGDMLYLAPDASGPRRVQGCFISDDELEEVVMYWNNWREEQIADGHLEEQRIPPWERGMTRLESLSELDPMLEEAIEIVCEAKEASTSLIQRRLGIGYPRAARLMDSLYELGIIGPPKSGGKAREVRFKNYKEALKQIKKYRQG